MNKIAKALKNLAAVVTDGSPIRGESIADYINGIAANWAGGGGGGSNTVYIDIAVTGEFDFEMRYNGTQVFAEDVYRLATQGGKTIVARIDVGGGAMLEVPLSTYSATQVEFAVMSSDLYFRCLIAYYNPDSEDEPHSTAITQIRLVTEDATPLPVGIIDDASTSTGFALNYPDYETIYTAYDDGRTVFARYNNHEFYLSKVTESGDIWFVNHDRTEDGEVSHTGFIVCEEDRVEAVIFS